MDVTPGLNDFDYAVLCVVGLSGIFALMRGFVREVLSLAAWAVAYFAAAKLYPYFEPDVHRYIKNPTAVTVIAILIIFVFVLVVMSLIANFVAGYVRGTKLTAVDRSLGFLFGLARGGLVVALIYLGAATVVWPDLDKPRVETAEKNDDKTKVARLPAPEWFMNARTRPALAYGAHYLKAFVPQSQLDKTSKKYEEQKAAAERLLEQQKQLDVLSTVAPVSAVAKDKKHDVTSDDNTDSHAIENLINQKGGAQ